MTNGDRVNMPVQFSRHALEKMHRRNVDISDAYATLEYPDEVYEDVEHRTVVAVKKVDAKYSFFSIKWRLT
jgi:hypothetical protein